MIQIILISIIIICFAMGVLTIVSNPKKMSNRLAAAIDFLLALWILSVLIYTETTSLEIAAIFSIVYFSLAAIFIMVLVIFVSVFPDDSRPSKTVVISAITACALIVFGIAVPGLITGREYVGVNGNCHEINQLYFFVYNVYYALMFLAAFYILARKLINATDKKVKTQLKIYLFGVVALFLPAAYCDLWLHYWGDCSWFWLGSMSVAAFVISLSYGIIRHGMFDIRRAAVRTLAYLSSLAVLVAIYYVLAVGISNLFLHERFEINENPISVVLALVLLFVFQPIKMFFDKLTNRIFYRDYYNSDEFFSRLNRILISTINLRRLLERVANEIASTLKSEEVFFYIDTMHSHHISTGTKNHPHLTRDEVTSLQSVIRKKTDIILISSLTDDNPIYGLMKKYKVELILPLSQDGMFGYLFLGEHRTSNYTSRDISVLKTVVSELLIAIRNAQSVEEVRKSNNMLRQLDKAKDEFISVAGHELRTPMTVIRGFMSLLGSGQAGPINGKQKEVIEKISNNTKTLINLVNNMLDLAKLEANKLELNISDVPINDLINNSIEKIRLLFDGKNVSITYRGIDAVIKTDPEKFERIMLNILSNANKFTESGGSVEVSATIGTNRNFVTICVADTGIGISKSDIGSLFKKFSQVDEYLQTKSDGTGLGLAICKQLVEKMDGKIWVESEVGKGSRFYFTVRLSDIALTKP